MENGKQENLIEPYNAKTTDEIKEIALGIFKGSIFTSLQIKNQFDISCVFIAAGFGDQIYIDWLNNNKICVFYEYLDKSLPRTINGYPIFTSHSHLNKEDTQEVLKKYEEIKKLMESL